MKSLSVFISVSSFLISGTLFSQNKFVPGWILNSKGDTIPGQVEYQLVHNIVQSTKFRSGDETKSFEPDEILGFGYSTGRFFKVRVVTAGGLVDQKIFVEVLVTGLVNLYRLGKNFLLEKDGKLYPLEEEVRLVIDQNVSYEHKSKKYIGTLNYLLRDCADQAIMQKINTAKLTEESLESLIDRYNRCKGAPSVVVKEFTKRETQIDLFVVAGMVRSEINFISGFMPTITDRYKSISTTNPVFGVGANFFNPSKIDGLALGVELYGSQESYMQNYKSDLIKEEQFGLKYFHLKSNVNLKYVLTHTTIAPYFKGGVSISKYASGKFISTQTLNNTSQTFRDFSGPINGTILLQCMVAFGLDIRLSNKFYSYVEMHVDGWGGDHNSNLYVNSTNFYGVSAKSLKTTIYALQIGFSLKGN